MTTPNTLDDVLTEDRLAAMRSAVMTEVGDDLQARRRRRTRRTAGMAAAAAIAVVAVGGGVLAGVLGGSASESAAPARTETAVAPAPAAPARTAGVAAPNAAPNATPTAPSTPTPITNNRQVITTGTIGVTSADPAATAKDLATTVERFDGRVDERRETRGDNASATLRLRLPSERISELIDRAGGLGTVGTVQLQHDDVTGTVVDLEARIRATQVSVDRLTAILAKAESTDQVIAAESALTSRQQELESLQSRCASIGDQVSLSTVTVTITKPQVTVDRSGFSGGLRNGWDALVGAGRWLLVIGGAVLPWMALLVVLYGIYRGVRRLRS
ncbi:DUF4349 domain-containing protein [Tsukamurella sputi]|uniref:DUF4349 domain-containing protein n=1 Tax=Tsukamurella sputi TaxID=2591848 RepID=A0A5C5RLR1_9ACTN|nr:DUF4349 domain-containing protein [Tsukamurella sputi]TWS23648.1 DUF4349 domain-containing protein [Tsukamurella sputi]